VDYVSIKIEMTNLEEDYVQRARTVLERIFAGIPKLTIAWHKPGTDVPAEVAQLVDFTLEITQDHRVYNILGAFKEHGFPQQLTLATDQLLRYKHKAGQVMDELMVAAPYISPEGARQCRNDNVSYFDLAGNCHIAMGSIYIERTGFANPFEKNAMAAPSLYGMRGERILRTLLNDPKIAWKVIPLAKQTGASAGTVSIVRKLLTERDWAKETPHGILLTRPEKLLRDWAQVWSRRAFRPFACFSRLGTQETEEKIAAFGRVQKRNVALTGAAAAWRYAPMTRYQRTQVYWDGEPEELAQAIDLKRTDSGANVHILAPRDRGVFDFLETIERVPIVCPVQAFLDLQRDPARGEEAAEQLWQTRLFRA
jgi:hypothetical protein